MGSGGTFSGHEASWVFVIYEQPSLGKFVHYIPLKKEIISQFSIDEFQKFLLYINGKINS
jgi:hypothetical protein